jgi:signal transduction histidine kinase
MKISTYIFLSFILILFLFGITTIINFRLSEAVAENNTYFSRSTEIVKLGTRFQRNLLTMVSSLRGYLITGERSFIASYDSTDYENEIILQEIASLVEDSQQIKLIREIKALNEQWIDGYAAPLKEAKAQANVSDSNLMAFNRLYRNKLTTGSEGKLQFELQEKFRRFNNQEYKGRYEHASQLGSSATKTKKISLLLGGASFVLGFVIVGRLVNRISGRIARMVKMADSIASGNYDVKMQNTEHDELSSLTSSLNRMAGSLAYNISELETKNKELDQFAHIVSHDLKGPLRGIGNVIRWIEEDHIDEVPERINKYLQLIKGRVERAENLIQGILAYARTDSETIAKEIVDLNILIREGLNDQALSEQVLVHIEHLPVLYTEKIPLVQVFSNLISNAIKYNDKSVAEIKIYYKEYAAHYEFFVSDNGPGIPEQYHDRIFVIFQTLRERDSFESTGVGLAIVKKILDARKEKIHVKSNEQQGSVFSFTWKKESHAALENRLIKK